MNNLIFETKHVAIFSCIVLPNYVYNKLTKHKIFLSYWQMYMETSKLNYSGKNTLSHSQAHFKEIEFIKSI